MVDERVNFLIEKLENLDSSNLDAQNLKIFYSALKLPFNENFYNIFLRKNLLTTIELDIYAKKSTDEQINLILDKSIPVDFKRVPILLFLLIKNYSHLINKIINFFKTLPYEIKKQVLGNLLFDDKLLLEIVSYFKDDVDFVKILVELQRLNSDMANILADSYEPEVLFYLSNYDPIVKRDKSIIVKLLKNPYTPDDSLVKLKQLFYEIKEKELTKKIEKDSDKPHDADNKEKKSEVAILEKLEEKVEEKLSETLYTKILKMSVPEKIKLALKGNKSARNILIKDSNKQIALSVLKNPMITLDEIDKITKNKSTPDYILREIARGSNWIKDYQIVRNLVFNPKTPPDISIHLLNRLYLKDLEILSKSKDVPNVVQAQAYRLVQQKNKAKK
ncbi:hypothetical protein OWM07_07105 [Deferribacter thermophilus]|uniref:hypothetical protein n=1 Tax=Deferribacter thermophilus TaxID=53573 RepID=UPI003C1F834D